MRPEIAPAALSLLDVAPECRLTTAQALDTLRAVDVAVGRWREVAGELGVSDNEIALMARAFERDARAEARARVAAA